MATFTESPFSWLAYNGLTMEEHILSMQAEGKDPEQYCQELADMYEYMTDEPQPEGLYDALLTDLLAEMEAAEA